MREVASRLRTASERWPKCSSIEAIRCWQRPRPTSGSSRARRLPGVVPASAYHRRSPRHGGHSALLVAVTAGLDRPLRADRPALARNSSGVTGAGIRSRAATRRRSAMPSNRGARTNLRSQWTVATRGSVCGAGGRGLVACREAHDRPTRVGAIGHSTARPVNGKSAAELATKAKPAEADFSGRVPAARPVTGISAAKGCQWAANRPCAQGI